MGNLAHIKRCVAELRIAGTLGCSLGGTDVRIMEERKSKVFCSARG